MKPIFSYLISSFLSPYPSLEILIIAILVALIIYAGLASILGAISRSYKNSFWPIFFISFFFTPIIGAICLLFDQEKGKKRKLDKDEDGWK